MGFGLRRDVQINPNDRGAFDAFPLLSRLTAFNSHEIELIKIAH